jgi:endonuclease V-like protein UPF0215 family
MLKDTLSRKNSNIHKTTKTFLISGVKKLMFEFCNLNRLQNMTFVPIQCVYSNNPYLEVTKRTIVTIYMEEEQHIILCYRHFKVL